VTAVGSVAQPRWRQAAPWAALVLFLPVAVLGLTLLPNEYESWGGSGVDCDGPYLLVFAGPAAVVYALLTLVFGVRAVRRRDWAPGLGALLSALLVAGLWGNIREARAELADPDHRLVCERR
jgi:hypothetical protein